jgi:hypothetical protein
VILVYPVVLELAAAVPTISSTHPPNFQDFIASQYLALIDVDREVNHISSFWL